jgi:hypothetical protein
MLAFVLSALIGVASALPPSFVGPKGWVEKKPPPDEVDAIWLSPHFGVNGNGENLTVASHPTSSGATLASEIHDAIASISQDREISGSHAEPTCAGRQPGWSFDGRLPIPNGVTVEQIYHIALLNGRTYVFTFTHAAGQRVDPAIAQSIQSICPLPTTS